MEQKQYLKHYGWNGRIFQNRLTKSKNPKQNKEKIYIYQDVSLWNYRKIKKKWKMFTAAREKRQLPSKEL